MSWQKCMSFSKCSNLEAKNVIRDCSFEIREGGGERFGGRVIKFLTSFLGGFKIYNTRFGGLQIFLHKIIRI